jgi:phage terminase large subunit GpA-like protein
LVIILSIQTKLGIKINILVDRLNDLWNGTTEEVRSNVKSTMRIAQPGAAAAHSPSRADFLDESTIQQGIFPPAPIATSKPVQSSYDTMVRGPALDDYGYSAGPVAANGLLGGSFGSSF